MSSLYARIFTSPQPLPISTTATRYMSRACAVRNNDGFRRAGPRKLRDGNGRNGIGHAVDAWEDIFITSLVAAASCPIHKAALRSTWNSAKHQSCRAEAARPSLIRKSQSRQFSSCPSRQQTAVAVQQEPNISKKEYKGLVDTYPEFANRRPSKKELKRAEKEKEKQKEHYSLAPRLVLTAEQEDNPPYGTRLVLPPENDEHAQKIDRLYKIATEPLGHISHAELWEAYEVLPSPRPRYLEDDLIKRIFRHFTWVELNTKEMMRRYFALLDDCVAERVRVKRMYWNRAIRFAGAWLKHATSEEVRYAIETWMRMEQAGHPANHVTFNILFNIAVRAGRFALADTIHNELKARGMQLDRYFRSSYIYYAGMRRDGDAVRQAFRDLVNAGEIVDTTTMNIVIISLLRAGEAPAAENVFYRMKRLHEKKFGTAALRHWRERKELAQLLNKTGEELRQEKEDHTASFFGAHFADTDRREEVQKASPIAPNAQTYSLLIRYHAYTSGDIDAVHILLSEMHAQEWHVHGSIYLHLLRGFYTHGGYASSAWTYKQLEELWKEITNSMTSSMSAEASNAESKEKAEQSEMQRPLYFTVTLALAALHAFYRCAGRKRMLEVWQDISARWEDASLDERSRIQNAVDQMVREDSMYIK